MTAVQDPRTPKAAVSHICLSRLDDPYIEGHRCGGCGEVFLEVHARCARCFGDDLTPARLGDTGRLYNFTIVHRSFPGVVTPFVSAIVDMDGGGVVRGTLKGAGVDPAALAFDMPVRLVFGDSGQKDEQGAPYIAYHFVPSQGPTS
ncbi:MAG: putative nucleic-acid-binding protein [Caulobacter sp.]|nr:putative nucleic-acid-binding protein [Caulobacter sp.]